MELETTMPNFASLQYPYKSFFMNRSSSFSCSFGWQNGIRDSLHFLDDNTLLTATGNVVILLDLKTMSQRFIHAVKGVAITALTVHTTYEEYLIS
jgi:hypothetical protein